VSGVLARIKALFAPSREPTPPPVVDEPPISTIAVTEPEALADEPIAVVEASAAPAPPAEAAAAEAAPPVEEAPAPAPPTVTAPPQAAGLTLRLETELGARSTFEVTKSGATIGRGPESTIQLPDLSVSRKHAKITYKQGAHWLSDLGSMGGTWIDGTKLAAPRRVATGQTIDIGLCRLTVVMADAAEEAPA
jgi:hypothetical protein